MFTTVDSIPIIVAEAVASKQKCRDIAFRKQQLRQLYKMLDENEQDFYEALHLDLKKPAMEAIIYELVSVKNDIVTALDNLEAWIEPETASTFMVWAMDSCQVERVPWGTVLIIGTWNYPVVLTLAPLVSAIAGGNSAVIKMSEVSHHTGELMARLITRYLDNDAYQPVTGEVPQATALLKCKFDFIFYTGNTMVGKIIMQEAAKTLTPVVLELGGKAPVIIDKNVNLKHTAKRIMWGKSVNCGQTCMAPDYVLVDKSVSKEFVQELGDAAKSLFPEGYSRSANYGRIVSDRHFDRLTDMLKSQLQVQGTSIAFGGSSKKEERFIEPTVLVGIEKNGDNPIMKAEIFGPILPVLEYETLDEAIAFVNKGSNPLSVYPQSQDPKFVNKVFDEINAGNALSNDVMVNFVVENIPFGGVGESGLGQYHGKFGFDTFTRPQAKMRRYTPEVLVAPRYQNFAYDIKSWRFQLIKLVFTNYLPPESVLKVKSFIASLIRKFGGARLWVGIILGLFAGSLIGKSVH